MERVLLKIQKSRTAKEKLACHEGDEARQKFERTMKALFQVPKADSKKFKRGKD
jgi:hypothetical protein